MSHVIKYPPAIPTIEPSEAGRRQVIRNFQFSRHLMRPIVRRVGTFSFDGGDKIPKDEPFLFLANHSALWDPLWLSGGVMRPIHFMATQSAMREPFLGRLLQSGGTVPKRKFSSDATAVKKLRSWAKLGGSVALFPEGARTWDGTPLPLVPGIDKLIRLIGLPVVTARIINADRGMPRWGNGSRYGHVHVEYDTPKSFDRRTPLDEIFSYVDTRIRVDPLSCKRWPVTGKRLAEGLTMVLFACPKCYYLEGLSARGNFLQCTSCTARWRVDTTNHLIAVSRSESLSIIAARERLHQHFSVDYVPSASLFRNHGVLLESEVLTVYDAGGSEMLPLAAGKLQLTPTELRVAGTDYSLPLESIQAVSIDIKRRLQLLVGDKIIEPVLPRESVLKWQFFTKAWVRRAGGNGAFLDES